ncbi:MAG: hypothetical protein EP312_04270 [Gammaproteobacteria bacterium]|nr:MAG: hypothetical protein EP312_04270 [Gammaproteobacteria bacterium]
MRAAALALLILLYPLAVYFGLTYWSARWVGMIVAAVFFLRLLLLRQHRDTARQLLPAVLVALCCALVAAILNHEGALKLVPVAINATMLAAFALTLRNPPSMIERFARLMETDLSDDAITYTRTVTKVWCGFFVLNGGISLYTALYSSLAIWTLYNGLIAYLLMGLLFGVEYLVRQRVKQHAGGDA